MGYFYLFELGLFRRNIIPDGFCISEVLYNASATDMERTWPLPDAHL